MQATPLESMPGFRRRFRITPESSRVCCEVEDDYHCMSVTVYHDGSRATQVQPLMRRVPWTTCPGAVDELEATFSGVALEDFRKRGARKSNCTHLYDLAQLAAQHAFDAAPLIYDILVSDPVDGRRWAQVRRGGRTVLEWTEAEFKIIEPQELEGVSLWNLQSWMASLEPSTQEAAKLLRWGNMLANGRTIPIEQQSDASRMPPNCYTFQPQRAVVAKRIGEVRDFAAGSAEPLQEYEAFT